MHCREYSALCARKKKNIRELPVSSLAPDQAGCRWKEEEHGQDSGGMRSYDSCLLLKDGGGLEWDLGNLRYTWSIPIQ